MRNKLTGDELAAAGTGHRSSRGGPRIPLSRSWNQLEGRTMRDVQLKIIPSSGERRKVATVKPTKHHERP